MNIFVCYTTRDSIITKEFLCLLSKKLRAYYRAYIDILDNDSDDKQLRVAKELIQSDVLLLLDTKSVSDSPWVRWELETASEFGIPIVRVNVSDLENIDALISELGLLTKS